MTHPSDMEIVLVKAQQLKPMVAQVVDERDRFKAALEQIAYGDDSDDEMRQIAITAMESRAS